MINPCPWVAGKKPTGVKPKQIIVAGTRTFNQPELLYSKLDEYTWFFDLVEVHIGGFGEKQWCDVKDEYVNVGADWFANVWAEKHWWTKHIHHADWDSFKKAAGPIRNREMAKAVAPNGFLVCFWDGKSPGTKSMIGEFLKYNSDKRLRVVKYKER